MQAVLAAPEGAVVREIPMPEPGAAQLLVQVHTAGLNRADLGTLTQAQGGVLGMEWAGIVKEVGAGVEGFKPGDWVMCAGKGGFAEYAVADAGRSVLIPAGMDLRQAGSLMLALQTAHDAIVTHAQVKKGAAVLIQGASSGVGIMAAKLARWAGAQLVVGTSRDAERRQALEAEGLDLVLDSTQADWTETLLERTENRGVDAIIDFVSGPGFNDLIKVSAVLGRIVNVGRLGGAHGEFDFEAHALKRLTYTGVTFRTRTPEEISVLNAAMLRDLGPSLERGDLALPLDEDFAMADAQKAFDHMAANRHFGKITLRVRD